MKILRDFTLHFTLLFCIINYGITQTAGGLDPIDKLKNGILVVRLDMRNNTIEAYEKTLTSSSLSQKDMQRIKEKLDALKIERQDYKKNVMQSFKENYNFSDLIFVENQNFKAFLEGEAISFDAKDHRNKDLQFNPDKMFFLIKGGNDGKWSIVNDQFKKPNFPNYFTLGFKNVINMILGEESYSIKNQSHLANKINTKLQKYYSKR